MPERIQRRRTLGWRKPEGAIIVTRPGPYGNPFPANGDWIVWTAVAMGLRADAAGRRRAAARLYRLWIAGTPVPLQPETGAGGSLEFSDGTSHTMEAHTRGIAGLAASLSEPPVIPATRPDITALAGHDLACWCPLEDEPGVRAGCHADVLLELANPDIRFPWAT